MDSRCLFMLLISYVEESRVSVGAFSFEDTHLVAKRRI